LRAAAARLAHFLRARQQEASIVADDLRYRLLHGSAVAGLSIGLEDLPALAARRWAGKRDAPFHVVYLGHPSNWEEHNLPVDPGLAGTVSAVWLRDLGFTEYQLGALRRRADVGPAVLERLRAIDAGRPVHLVVSYLAGSHVLPEHVRGWASLGLVTAGFHLDDRLFFRGSSVDGVHAGPADTCRAYDLSLTNVRRSLTKYAASGARALFWPEGANPGFFRPLGLQRTHDVAFLGGRYGPRGAVLERLERDGFSVLAHGPGWPGGEVPAAGVPEIMNRGRVVLGFSGIGRSMSATCLKGRDFEAPMCGAAYLPSWNPELPLVYELGREVAPWRSYQDLRRRLRLLLADEAGLERMREAALARARGEHTWAHRVGSLAEAFGHPWRPFAAVPGR
jgi:hypothetical protein